jgi:hypothetical protein
MTPGGYEAGYYHFWTVVGTLVWPVVQGLLTVALLAALTWFTCWAWRFMRSEPEGTTQMGAWLVTLALVFWAAVFSLIVPWLLRLLDHATR